VAVSLRECITGKWIGLLLLDSMDARTKTWEF
jgi:hypothetical protein